MPEPLPPPSVFRNEAIYRTVGEKPAPVHGCGFFLKPTSEGGYHNRVMQQDMVVVYVLRGSGTFTDWESQKHSVGPGDLALMPAGKPHGIQQHADGLWAEAYITLDGGFGAHLVRLGVLDESVRVMHPGIDLSLIQGFERILDDLTHLPDYALPSVLVQAHELLTAASQLHRKSLIPNRQQQIVETACHLLSQDLPKRIDMEQIAASLDMSYERFRKLFRQRVGVSPGDYRIRRRIDRARALIWQHRMSNKQIAYELGYPDPFTFSKQFKKMTNLWPDEYRRSLVSADRA
jgi:AraC family transcriptional regulator, arabinose operon regulatory protein